MKDHVLVVPLLRDEQTTKTVLGSTNIKKRAANGMPHPWSIPIGRKRTNESPLESAKRIAKEVFRRDFPNRRFDSIGSYVENERLHHVFTMEIKEREVRKRMPRHRFFLAYEWHDIRSIPWAKTRPGSRALLEKLIVQPREAA